MSLSLNYPTTGPSLMLDFANSGVLDPRITFTRASTATYFDASGTLQSAAIDAPRFDYNPSTLAAQGLLIEEARTNSIRNNTMQGAVAGTPGTLPTNWALGGISGGLATQIVETGTENGITYIDIRIFGTNSSGSSVFPGVFFDTTTAIAATTGQVWSSSVYFSLAAGTGISFELAVHEADSGGVFLRSTTISGTGGIPTTGSLATRRRAGSVTLGASTAFVRPLLAATVTNGQSVDITLRIGLPQLELGAFATSVIPTTTAALTRAADVASVNTLSPWFNSAQGTIFAEGVTNRPYTAVTGGQMAQISDGTQNNRIWIAQGNTTSNTATNTLVSISGSNVAELNYGPVPSANYLNKSAFAYATNDFAGCTGGGTLATDPLGAVPTATTLYLGISASLSSASNWNGYLRRITYYPRRLSNAELQTLTS